MDSEEIKKETSESIQLPTYKIMVDNVPVKEKPENAGIIINRLNAIKEVTIPQLFKYLSLGYTVRPGILNGTTENDFKQQEFIFIDVDNDIKKDTITTLDETLSIFKKYNLNPIGYYYSFSHTKEYPRYRIVFRIEKPITESIKIKLLLSFITNLIPNADTSCNTVVKIFYGTNKSYEILDANAVITLEQVESLIATTITATSKDNDKKNSFNKDLNQQIKDFDFYSYLCNETKTLRKGSNYIAFDVCPICGHNDCLRYYPNSNSFYCFGSNGNVGGSIIEYLMETKKMNKKEAINYFKYEILKLPKEKQLSNEYIEKVKQRNKEIIEEQIKELDLEIKLPENIDWLGYRENNEGRIITIVLCPRLAKFIKENLHYFFINTETDEKVPKYFYKNGVYKMFTDKSIKKIIKSLIPLDIVTVKNLNEVFDLMCMDSKYIDMDKLNNNEDIINFKNGILHLSTGQMEPHNPKYVSTIQYNINYIENPAPPKKRYFDNYLKDLTNGDEGQQQLLWEFIGAVISNVDGSKFKSSLILCGPGNTGKSQFPILLEKIVGKDNYTSADLRDMNKSFNKINLLNKRLASFSDVTTLRLESLDAFKKITGGDSLNDSWKFKDSVNFKYTGNTVMTMNEFIKFGGDSGDHVWERFIPIETTNIIPPEKRDKNLVKHMLEEKEYIISKALKMFKRVVENGYNYTIPDSVLKTREKYRIDHESVKKFIKECTEIVIREPDPADPTTGQFYSIYQNWVKANNLYDEGHSKFREIMLKETKKEKPKKTYGGNTYYIGIVPLDEVRVTFGEEKGVFKKQM